MVDFGKLAARHFGILLIYVIAFRLLGYVRDLSVFSMFGSASMIVFHAFYLMLSSPAVKDGVKVSRGVYVLAGLCILLIGMPTCFFIFISGIK